MKKLFGVLAAVMLALIIFSSPAAARCWWHGARHHCWHHRYYHRHFYRPYAYSGPYFYPYAYYPAAYYYRPAYACFPIWPFCW